ncbi:MAG: lipoyl(octanoyl) transferase LipB, partial [bacterium]|nr:lipoyl(octanoyl) transferase LipB [bacterium]
LVEHDPVMTVGRSGGWEFLKTSQEILDAKGIILRETDRGGKITYHGPGQLVGYPIIKVAAYGWSPPELVDQIQQMLISVLADLGLQAKTQEKMIGVWTKADKKIASIGIRVTQGVSRHGFALNVSNDLSPFQLMNPCGLNGVEMTSVKKEGTFISMDDVKKKITLYWMGGNGSSPRDRSSRTQLEGMPVDRTHPTDLMRCATN